MQRVQWGTPSRLDALYIYKKIQPDLVSGSSDLNKENGMPAVRSRALKRAIEIVGGIEILAMQLDVSSGDLVLWSQGTKLVPEEVFLRAVDIVTAAEIINGKQPPINEPDADTRSEGKPRE